MINIFSEKLIIYYLLILLPPFIIVAFFFRNITNPWLFFAVVILYGNIYRPSIDVMSLKKKGIRIESLWKMYIFSPFYKPKYLRALYFK